MTGRGPLELLTAIRVRPAPTRVTQLRFDHRAAIEACSGTDTVALQAW